METPEKVRDVADAVAAVLERRRGFNGWFDDIDEKTQEEILGAIGHAAIEAMRAPSPPMIDRLADRYAFSRAALENIWAQMIDAALEARGK